jgi:DNA-directed RNA polymerase subunit K/omega
MERMRNAYAKGIEINEGKDKPTLLAIPRIQKDNIKIE